MTPDLSQANERVSTYLCGTCGTQETAAWLQHQAHYDAHREATR